MGLKLLAGVNVKGKDGSRTGGLVGRERGDGRRQRDGLDFLIVDYRDKDIHAFRVRVSNVNLVRHRVDRHRIGIWVRSSRADGGSGVGSAVDYSHRVAVKVGGVDLIRHRIHRQRKGIRSNCNGFEVVLVLPSITVTVPL